MDLKNIVSDVQEIIDEKSLMIKLSGEKKLRIKLGVDPSRPDLHLGHAIVLRKLRQFQDLGHTIIFLIGDYTALIGDPSGRNTTRPILNNAEIEENTSTYLDQVGKIVDLSKCEVRRNSEWYSKMNFADILGILSKVTISNVIEREDFRNRIATHQEVAMSELIYPIMQGYDSVYLESDVEIGGQDQKLNMLMGRDLQKKMGQVPQDVITMPLLVGTDGKKKMSKSYDNYIGISEEPTSQFGKIMSIPDSAIADYIKLASNFTPEEKSTILDQLKKSDNPRDIKEALAINIVSDLHSLSEAQMARDEFIKVFRNKEIPQDIKEINLHGEFSISQIIVESGLAESKSQARRLVEQGAVKVDSEVKKNPEEIISSENGFTLSVGKRNFIKVKIDA